MRTELAKTIDRLLNEKEPPWTRAELARRMGVKHQAVSQYLQGKPRKKTLERMAEVLGVPVKCLSPEFSDSLLKTHSNH